jgi:hypothetical protein
MSSIQFTLGHPTRMSVRPTEYYQPTKAEISQSLVLFNDTVNCYANTLSALSASVRSSGGIILTGETAVLVYRSQYILVLTLTATHSVLLYSCLLLCSCVLLCNCVLLCSCVLLLLYDCVFLCDYALVCNSVVVCRCVLLCSGVLLLLSDCVLLCDYALLCSCVLLCVTV